MLADAAIEVARTLRERSSSLARSSWSIASRAGREQAFSRIFFHRRPRRGEQAGAADARRRAASILFPEHGADRAGKISASHRPMRRALARRRDWSRLPTRQRLGELNALTTVRLSIRPKKAKRPRLWRCSARDLGR